jgi:hypothetical protein
MLVQIYGVGNKIPPHDIHGRKGMPSWTVSIAHLLKPNFMSILGEIDIHPSS